MRETPPTPAPLRGIAGDHVHALPRHVIERRHAGVAFETTGEDDLRTNAPEAARCGVHARRQIVPVPPP